MAVKGVTFDWWGTIAAIPDSDEAGAMRELRLARLEDMLRDRGIRADRSAMLVAYERQSELLEEAWAHHRELGPDEQVRAFLGFAGIDGGSGVAAAIGDAIGGAILVRRPALFPPIEDLLRRLAAQGLAIGLISNTGRSWGRYLTDLQEAVGIGRYFRARAYSDEVRVRKPDPRIFEAALSGLGLMPDEVVHVGDDVVADIAGAKAVGMRAVWFNTGYWSGASTDRADAEIHGLAELPALLEAWR